MRKGTDCVSWSDGHMMFFPHLQHIFTKDEIQFKCNYCFNSSDTTGHQSVMMYCGTGKQRNAIMMAKLHIYNFHFNNPYTYYQLIALYNV
jgi:hypothetical protein